MAQFQRETPSRQDGRRAFRGEGVAAPVQSDSYLLSKSRIVGADEIFPSPQKRLGVSKAGVRSMSRMLTWISLVFLSGLGPVMQAAEPAPALHYSKPAVRKEIAGVVEAQLEAFRTRDFEGAYSWAASPLRERFTLQMFAAMIARGYPLILRHDRTELGLPMDDGVRAVLSVRLWAKGESVVYRYTLLKEAAGWRVSGVTPEREKDSDA